MEKKIINDIRIDVSDEIFKFLNPISNDKINILSNSDRIYMMYLLKQYYLGLRDKLNIDKDVSFGLEIEFENAYRDLIEQGIYNQFPDSDWEVVDDGSLVNGGEVRSPRLFDYKNNWIDLSKVCDIVDRNAYVMDNVGSHIHIGMHILGNNPKYFANFAKLWLAYENVIFRFLNGEYISHRSGMQEQARPIAVDLVNKMKRIDETYCDRSATHIIKILDSGIDRVDRRKRCVNLTNIEDFQAYQYNQMLNKNTIEFRSPNGTFDPVIWQNNVNFLVALLMYAKSDNFDLDLINRRISQVNVSEYIGNLKKYNYLYIDQAIELADLIFDNNLDKVYFLRQYIKDGSVTSKSFVKSRSFTSR